MTTNKKHFPFRLIQLVAMDNTRITSTYIGGEVDGISADSGNSKDGSSELHGDLLKKKLISSALNLQPDLV